MGGHFMGKEDKFTTPTNRDIIDILNLLNESDFDELRLEMTGLKLHFSKSAIDSTNRVSGRLESPVSLEPMRPAESVQEGKEMDVAKQPAQHEEEGLIPIKAPLLGIFYRAPKPGAPPFVEVGDYVREDDTVCLVEVMKLFNTVKAGVRGRIVKICVESNQMVEYNQTLFLIDPAGTEGP